MIQRLLTYHESRPALPCKSPLHKKPRVFCSWPAAKDHIACGLKRSGIDRDTPDSDSSDFSLVSGVTGANLRLRPSTCGPGPGC